jgi:lipid-binding SYLF domain-containing protein
MRFVSAIRAALVALVALAGATSLAHADSGTVYFKVLKAGFVIGGSGGSGTLTFHGRSYPFTVGGLSYGFTFGAAETVFTGTVSHIRSPRDIAGVYGAASAGVAGFRGPGVIALQNANGALLKLAGKQKGLIVNVDLNGMAISLR